MRLEDLYVQITSFEFFRPLLALFIIICTFVIARIISYMLKKREAQDTKLLRENKTQFRFLRHVIIGIIYVAGFAIAISVIPSLERLAVSMFAGAGVLAVVVGFASQKAFSNIVSGMFIAIFKPFRIGDLVQVQGITGHIEEITLRHTVIKDFESVRHIIPNSVISEETITNNDIVEDEKCKHYEIGISYDSDLLKAIEILRDEAENHPLTRDHRTPTQKKENAPKVKVEVVKLDNSSVNLRAWIWVHQASDEYQLSWDLNKNLKLRFDKEGIEIPYPHQTVFLKKTT